ncbi:MAG: hypothetical protein WAU86_15840, partial [Oricola sp.]
MSEFANFIRVAVQGLPDDAPSHRAAAYDRARKAVRRQLEARSASSGEITQKLDQLEDAILDLEAELSLSQPAETAEADPLAAFETELTAGLAASAAAEDKAFEDAVAAEWAGDGISGEIDIRALLRKALAKQDASDPATREIIYGRARKGVARYLRRLTPPPDYATVHSCIGKLNEAIRETEAEAAALAKDQHEIAYSVDTDEVMQEIGGARPDDPKPAAEPGFPDFRSALSARSTAGDAIAAEVEEALRDLMAPDPMPAARPVAAVGPEPAVVADEAGENVLAGDLFVQPEFPTMGSQAAPPRNGRMSPPPAYVEEPVRRGRGGLGFLALVALLCVGGGAVAYT